MKGVPLVLSMFFLGAAALPAQEPAEAVAESVELAAGVLSGALRASGTTAGATYGDCISLSITNAGDRAVRVVFAPGILVAPADTTKAGMVLANLRGRTLKDGKTEVISDLVLAPGQTDTFTFLAYSREFARKDAPARSGFSVVGSDPVLGRLLRLAEEEGAPAPVTQAAVWFYSGGMTPKMLALRIPLGTDDVARARDLVRRAAASGP